MAAAAARPPERPFQIPPRGAARTRGRRERRPPGTGTGAGAQPGAGPGAPPGMGVGVGAQLGAGAGLPGEEGSPDRLPGEGRPRGEVEPGPLGGARLAAPRWARAPPTPVGNAFLKTSLCCCCYLSPQGCEDAGHEPSPGAPERVKPTPLTPSKGNLQRSAKNV